jgi:hypothetical protein
MEITHRFVFCLKHDVSETGFCLRLQVELTFKLGPIDRTSLCLKAQLNRFHLMTETESSLQNVVF